MSVPYDHIRRCVSHLALSQQPTAVRLSVEVVRVWLDSTENDDDEDEDLDDDCDDEPWDDDPDDNVDVDEDDEDEL